MRRVERLMGTVFTFDVRSSKDPTSVLDDVVAWLRRIDQMFSPFREDSQISLLDSGQLSLDSAAPEVRSVLSGIAVMSERTSGFYAFRPSGRLDPCGYVKGWAVERASRQLSAAGFADHAVNGGGDVRTCGQAGNRDWGVGIADPFRPDRVAWRLDAPGLAIATSGTAERGLHVVDPHSGAPTVDIASLTVIGPDLATADALATAGVAMGRRARDWLESVPGHIALAIMADGRTWRTGHLQADNSEDGEAHLVG
jgi:thiamine biosynthesis lipoprotein